MFHFLVLSVPLLTPALPPPAARQESAPASPFKDPQFQRRFAESYLAEAEVEPRVTSEERERMLKVMELIADDKLGAAVSMLEKSRGPAASAVFDFTLGNVHFQSERFESAEAAYRVAVDKHPKFRRAWHQLGLSCFRAGRFEGAVAAFQRALETGGSGPMLYGLLGYSFAQLRNDLAAESAFRMAHLLDPQTQDWKVGLASSLLKQRRFLDATALLGQLIEERPEQASLWLLQANALIGSGKVMEAAQNYELVEHLGQSTQESLVMLGDIYANEDLFDLASAAYQRALERFPALAPERPLRAAKRMLAKGAHVEAAGLLERVAAVRTDTLTSDEQREILRLRARVAMARGAGDEEAAILERIVELDPLDGEALIQLGQHAQRSGRAEQAVFHFERAAALEAFEAQAKLRHAQLLVGQGKYTEALPLLRRAQALQPRENVQRYLDQVERAAGAR